MTSARLLRCMACRRTALMLLCCVLVVPISAYSQEFSRAETLLWMTDQLANVDKPLRLEYTFEKSGTLEAGFTDTVEFIVDSVNGDGTKAAHLEFFTGERNFPVPPVASTTVNPVLKVYLQGDVYEMNRLTDPDGTSRERWRYFQRRLKFAFAEGAKVMPASFDFAGQTYSGTEIVVEPYRNDPRRDQFEMLAEKRYRFVVSDELPGYLYSIETFVPGEGDEPLIREYLELSQVQRTATAAPASN